MITLHPAGVNVEQARAPRGAVKVSGLKEQEKCQMPLQIVDCRFNILDLSFGLPPFSKLAHPECELHTPHFSS